jgi:substrate-binding family protein
VLAAFTEHAERAGLSIAPVEHALFSLEGGQAATSRMLRLGVTGVICASDVLALGAIRAVRRASLSVPGDVSVVGFDDSAWLNPTDPQGRGRAAGRPDGERVGLSGRAALRARASGPRLERSGPGSAPG